jgi:hypothetical protein
MKIQAMMSAALLSVAISFSATAACGGGGYTSSNSRPVAYSAQTQAATAGSRGPGFDARYFHAISGKLQLSGEQATKVINALNEIRGKEGFAPSKDFDAKKEFETRLATILNPQQLKIYQEATKAS